jgi:hypothetical protein
MTIHKFNKPNISASQKVCCACGSATPDAILEITSDVRSAPPATIEQ